MGNDDSRGLFLRLITEPDKEKRGALIRQLSSSEFTQIQAVAEAGRIIGSFLCGEANAEELERALRILNGMPMMDYWHSFHEMSGQALIRKALSMEPESGRREEAFSYGIRMFQAAISGGFPLSDISVELVRKATQEGKGAPQAGEALLKMNSMLLPEKKGMRPPGGSGTETEAKRKGRTR